MMSSISRKRRHSPEAYITSNRTNLNRWEPDHLLLRANTPSSDARASESYRTGRVTKNLTFLLLR